MSGDVHIAAYARYTYEADGFWVEYQRHSDSGGSVTDAVAEDVLWMLHAGTAVCAVHTDDPKGPILRRGMKFNVEDMAVELIRRGWRPPR